MFTVKPLITVAKRERDRERDREGGRESCVPSKVLEICGNCSQPEVAVKKVLPRVGMENCPSV